MSAAKMAKSHENKMSKLFTNDYDHYDVVKVLKCCLGLNFEKMDTAPCTGKK